MRNRIGEERGVCRKDEEGRGHWRGGGGDGNCYSMNANATFM